MRARRAAVRPGRVLGRRGVHAAQVVDAAHHRRQLLVARGGLERDALPERALTREGSLLVDDDFRICFNLFNTTSNTQATHKAISANAAFRARKHYTQK